MNRNKLLQHNWLCWETLGNNEKRYECAIVPVWFVVAKAFPVFGTRNND